ncbi:MAG: 50S ribosomal protein L29 [bacterium]
MYFEELKEKSKKELKNLLAVKQAKLMNMKFETSIGSLKNVREFRVIKKDIARIMTVVNKSAT